MLTVATNTERHLSKDHEESSIDIAKAIEGTNQEISILAEDLEEEREQQSPKQETPEKKQSFGVNLQLQLTTKNDNISKEFKDPQAIYKQYRKDFGQLVEEDDYSVEDEEVIFYTQFPIR